MRLRLDVSMIGNAGKGYVEITHLLLKLLPGGEMSFSDHISFAKASHMATANFKGSRKKNHKKCNPNKCLENQELWTFDVSVVSLPKPVTWPQLTSKEVGKKKKCNPNKCLENQELWTFDVSVVSATTFLIHGPSNPFVSPLVLQTIG